MASLTSGHTMLLPLIIGIIVSGTTVRITPALYAQLPGVSLVDAVLAMIFIFPIIAVIYFAIADSKVKPIDALIAASITKQWERAPASLVSRAPQCGYFISSSLIASRNSDDISDRRFVVDDDEAKDTTILFKINQVGRITNIVPVDWSMSFIRFESIVKTLSEGDDICFELVARLVNGHVHYLVALFSALNPQQNETVLELVTALNGLKEKRPLRQFRCRNFVQRGKSGPKEPQVL